MGYLRFNYRSDALGKYVNISIVYPTDLYCYYDMTEGVRHHSAPGAPLRKQYEKDMKFKTVYLIHGGGDDDTLPFRYTNVERYAQKNNVMIVTPDIANSFGADTNYGVDYQTFITQELPVVVQTLFASSDKKEDNYIVGFAMGGNVALASALFCPERYSVCADISGGIGYTLDTAQLVDELAGDHFRNNFTLYNSTFGEPEDLESSRHNLYKAALAFSNENKHKIKFYLFAGSEEGNIGKRVARDARLLRELDFDVTYSCFNGYKHDFVFWDMILAKLLNEVLPLER